MWQLSHILDTLASDFSELHACGVQQYKRSKSITEGLQKMSAILQPSSKTLSEPLTEVGGGYELYGLFCCVAVVCA